jgi:hypothetical protein
MTATSPCQIVDIYPTGEAGLSAEMKCFQAWFADENAEPSVGTRAVFFPLWTSWWNHRPESHDGRPHRRGGHAGRCSAPADTFDYLSGTVALLAFLAVFPARAVARGTQVLAGPGRAWRGFVAGFEFGVIGHGASP